MRTAITESLSLTNIEKIIKEELPGKKLWGDIELSDKEYENIKHRIRTLLEHPSISISNIYHNYPVSLTTFMVFLVRYDFNYNFWGLFSQELGIEINGNLENEIGDCVRRTFRKYGFDFSDVENERRKNLEPILYEAGRPPESCLDDLFYILKYDTYSVFDPYLIIDDLISMRSYQIRKPMLRFLDRFKDERAVEFVLEVHDTMNIVDQGMGGSTSYSENYIEWKEKEHTKESTATRKKKEFQTKPYLSFENGKKGLCMVLPRTILADEWMEKVEWVIKSNDGYEVRRKMYVMGDDGSRFTESIAVPVSASKQYTVALFDNESFDNSKIIEWVIDGIKEGGVLFFNSNGRLVKPGFLLNPYGIMILDKKASIKETQSVLLSNQNYPTDRGNYTTIVVEPTGSNAFVSYYSNGEQILRNRPQIGLELKGETLFGLNNNSNIYTKIPTLQIDIDEGALINGLKLCFGKRQLEINELVHNEVHEIDLGLYNEEFPNFGIYDIRLYQYDKFLKQTEFYYVPKISTNYDPDIKWPDQNSRHERKIYKFKKIPKWQITFEDCVVNSNEDYYLIECSPNIGTVHGVLRTDKLENGFSCGFELPINPFEIEMYDGQGALIDNLTDHVLKLGLSDIDEKEYWIGLRCYGDFINCHFKIILRTGNGIEQEESITLSQTGCGNFNLTSFYDTLRKCPLPAIVEICCDNGGDLKSSIVGISETSDLNERPVYVRKGLVVLGLNDDGKDLVVKRFGTGEELKLLYAESRLGKNKINRGYPCPAPLTEGIYTVDGDSDKDSIFIEETGMEISNGNNTMFVSYRDKIMTIASIADWLDQLIRDVICAGVNHNIQSTISYRYLSRINTLERTLDVHEYERMIALSYFINAKCIEAKKDSMRECMRAISTEVLDGSSRLEIIRMLSDINCNRDIFDICLEEYNLFLFEPGSKDAKQLAERVENYSTELSMMLLMSSDDTIRNAIWKDNYRELIGKEAIKCLLSVPGESDKERVLDEQRRFIREQKPCRVKINLTNKISGDMGPIQQMIEVTYNTIVFNKSKKPDYGVYFDRIRYVDQYVNWYSQNHGRDGAMFPYKKEMMIDVVKKDCHTIIKALQRIKKRSRVGVIAERYDKALRYRFDGDPFVNLNANQYPRYFYLQGIAALLAVLPNMYRIEDPGFRASEHFMANAITIAPKIARRDLLMAATFVYLMRKEEKLCR